MSAPNGHGSQAVSEDKTRRDVVSLQNYAVPPNNGNNSEVPSPTYLNNHAHNQIHSQNHLRNHNHQNNQENSQGTTATTDEADRIFTPSGSDSGTSATPGNVLPSSQDSQLLQLSQLAAQQEKMDEGDGTSMGLLSRKRTADGVIKHTRQNSMSSPGYTREPRARGHSRNASAISMISTAGSRIGEELQTKLHYAMLKVQNGWQNQSIDEVESLASRAVSPSSNSSTLQNRQGTSASPQLSLSAARKRTSSTGVSPSGPQSSARSNDANWRSELYRKNHHSASPPSSVGAALEASSQGLSHTLAPPVTIESRQSGHTNPRRNSTPHYTPSYLSHPHLASPQTPAQPSLLQSTPGNYCSRPSNADTMLFSPAHDSREQDAVETLMFLGSPQNSNIIRNASASSSSRIPLPHASRTALPNARPRTTGDPAPPRKPLPTVGRAQHHGPTSSQTKHVGFANPPSTTATTTSAAIGDADLQQQYHFSPAQSRGTPRRKTTSGHAPRLSFSTSVTPIVSSHPIPMLKDDDIDAILDRMASECSDSEGEIQLPPQRRRSQGTVAG